MYNLVTQLILLWQLLNNVDQAVILFETASGSLFGNIVIELAM